jgi:hypothetical protein
MKRILKSLALVSVVLFASNCFADANDVNDVIIQQGNITCASPINNNHAATKVYVDNAASAPGLVQIQRAQTQSYISTAGTVIPFDDSIPQSNEGTQILSVSITPTSATNLLRIDAFVNGYASIGYWTFGVAAIFQDSNTNALAAGFSYGDVHDGGTRLTYFMTAGTTSPTTFNLRCGGIDVNGSNGQRKLGGSVVTSLIVTEYKE